MFFSVIDHNYTTKYPLDIYHIAVIAFVNTTTFEGN